LRRSEVIRQRIASSSLSTKEKLNRNLEVDERTLMHKVMSISLSSGKVADSKKKWLCTEIDRLRRERESTVKTPNAWILGLCHLKWRLLQDQSSTGDLIATASKYVKSRAQMHHCLYDIGNILKTARELENRANRS
jgi:hypothetical protein